MERFFTDIRPEAIGGPEYRVTKKKLRGGGEKRNELWANPLRRYTVTIGPRDIDDISDLLDFLANTGGSAYPFLLKDWSDYKSCKPRVLPDRLDQTIGTGDDTTYYFRLTKAYGDSYSRRILKPVADTVVFAVDGVIVPATDGYVDYDNGVVVFKDPPASGVTITAGFEFDVPVWFDEDYVPIMLSSYRMGQAATVEMTEKRMVEDIDTDAYDAARALL